MFLSQCFGNLKSWEFMKVFCSLSCKAKVAAASDFDPSKYIVIVFSEIRVPPLYRHVLNNVCYLLYFEIEMEVVYNLTSNYQNRSLFKSATPPFHTALLPLVQHLQHQKHSEKKGNLCPFSGKTTVQA